MATEITWLGHNAWAILAGEHRLLLDPFLNDNYTMGPDDALEAVRLLRPRRVVPIHNGTWAIIAQDADDWARRVRAETGVEAIVLQPGGSITVSG